MSRSWYERALGGGRPQQPATNYPPSGGDYPPPSPGYRPQQQQQQVSAEQKQELLAAYARGEIPFSQVAALYEGGQGVRNAQMCPECGGDKFFRPTTNSVERCAECGYNARFQPNG